MAFLRVLQVHRAVARRLGLMVLRHFSIVMIALLWLSSRIEAVQSAVEPAYRELSGSFGLDLCAELLVEKAFVGDVVGEYVQARLGAAFAVAEDGSYVFSTRSEGLDVHLVRQSSQRRVGLGASGIETGCGEIFLPPPSDSSSGRE